MQLVEAGEVELDAPVQTYLPWFTLAGPEGAEQITVRHLLTHSSGISGPVSDKDLVNPDVSEAALETYVRELADYKLSRPVGESFSYANPNYNILGLIVQTVSGQSFEDYVEEHIFSPLEMTNSYTSKSEAEANGLAVGHTYFLGSPRVAADAPYSRRNIPAGFLISSAEDLGHYLIAQLNGGRYGEAQVLSPEYVALMHQPAVETDLKGISYAFGWRTSPVEGELTVRHGGDVSNFHSNMAFSPTRGWGVAILMNVMGYPQNAAVHEPINEVFRLSSGYDAGQPIQDSAPVFLVLWGIAILSAGLNLLFWGISYRRRRRKGFRLGLVRYLLLPLGLNLVPMWIMFIGFWSQLDAAWSPGVRVFFPDTWLVFLVSAAVIVLTMLARVVIYLRFARRAGSGSY
jgi:CubicO group peptidase (beta-lactamase class C family)